MIPLRQLNALDDLLAATRPTYDVPHSFSACVVVLCISTVYRQCFGGFKQLFWWKSHRNHPCNALKHLVLFACKCLECHRFDSISSYVQKVGINEDKVCLTPGRSKGKEQPVPGGECTQFWYFWQPKWPFVMQHFVILTYQQHWLDNIDRFCIQYLFIIHL